MKCYENKRRSWGLIHLRSAWRDVLLVLLLYTFTSCFLSDTVVNYWCYHHVSLPSLPPSPPSPSPSHTSPLQVSPSLTESPKNRLHTIPVTISNKAQQGEGWDAPWHLNQWLSYNNSMIFNLSLLPPSLQTPRQHTGVFFFPEKRKKKSALDICSGISGQMAKMAP